MCKGRDWREWGTYKDLKKKKKDKYSSFKILVIKNYFS